MPKKLVKKLFTTLNHKYRRSIYGYVILAVTSFLLTAALVIFNLFALRFNPANDADQKFKDELRLEKILFLCIIILGSISTFVSSLMAEFTFKKRAKEKKEKMIKLKIELKKYQNHEGDYAQKDDRDRYLINNAATIINE